MQRTLSSARLFRKKTTSSQCLLKSEKTLGTRVGRKNGMTLSVQCEFETNSPSKKAVKVRRIIRPNWTTAFFTLEMDYSSETDNPSSKSVKLTEKHTDKVRRIVHAKLRPVHFQITTYYLSDANYPTDNSSPVRKRQLSFNTAPN